MTYKNIVSLNCCVLASAALFTIPAVAEEYDFEMEVRIKFEFGDNCEVIDYLTFDDIREAVHYKNSEKFKLFCRPQDPYDCEDYTELLYGLGELLPSPETGYCEFIAWPEHREMVPDVYKWYG